jgi:hypothetical protein
MTSCLPKAGLRGRADHDRDRTTWLSVGHSHTVFVVENFIDEPAHAVQQDLLADQRALLRWRVRRGIVRLSPRRSSASRTHTGESFSEPEPSATIVRSWFVVPPNSFDDAKWFAVNAKQFVVVRELCSRPNTGSDDSLSMLLEDTG